MLRVGSWAIPWTKALSGSPLTAAIPCEHKPEHMSLSRSNNDRSFDVTRDRSMDTDSSMQGMAFDTGGWLRTAAWPWDWCTGIPATYSRW